MHGATLRAALRGGQQRVYGTMINFVRNPRAAALFGQVGLDFVVVDTEHAPNGRSETADAAAAFLSAGVCPILRVPHTEPHLTVMALDAGFHGVMVPYCETPEEVQAVVSAARLRPLKGALHARARDHGVFPSDASRAYLEKRNADTVVVIGIESVPALENLEKILDVPGVDALFIGPNDLSISLGIPLEYGHPRYVEAVEHIVRAAEARGIAAGPQCQSEAELVAWQEKGARFLVYSSDWRTLGEGYRAVLSAARGTPSGPIRRPL
jgi:2-keto-3-deoxy-L-rhamnonate aldolase RhmA